MSRLWQWLGRAAYWLSWPALWVYLRRGARTRVLVVAEGHVLVVLGWMGDSRWGLPGGGLHRREPPADGVVRETAEETGVVLSAAQLQPLSSEWRSGHGLTFYTHFFAATLPKRVPVRGQRGEILGVRWVPLDGLDAIPHKYEIPHALKLFAASQHRR